jgi:protein SMG8
LFFQGNITFYYEKSGNMLFVHFETTFDNYIMQQILEGTIQKDGQLDRFLSFHSYIRTRFARILLFATQVCHCVVMVEPGNVFDATYLSIFKSLKIIREKYVLKFLPKILKNSAAGQFFGKEGRLCSPRFLFFFEKPLEDCADEETLKRMEYDVEDDIYKMLRNEFIITNNSVSSDDFFHFKLKTVNIFFSVDEFIQHTAQQTFCLLQHRSHDPCGSTKRINRNACQNYRQIHQSGGGGE